MTDQKRGVKLGIRTIPVPKSISDEAQAALSRLVGEDGLPLHARYDMPASDDFAGWMTMKAAASAQYAASIRELAGKLDATISTIKTERATIQVATPKAVLDDARAILDLHGGALVFGGGDACQVGAQRQADQHRVRCYGVDYRMPPEHPFPAALDDCLSA